MKYFRYFTFTITLLVLSFGIHENGFAQTFKSWLNAGDKAMSAGKYAEAFEYYSRAVEFDTEDIRLYYKMATASRLYNDYVKALERIYTQDTKEALGIISSLTDELSSRNKAISLSNQIIAKYKETLTKTLEMLGKKQSIN